MVKGNWERRAEKASQRKAAQKEKKELKAKGLFVEPRDALARVFAADTDPVIFLDAPGGAALCRNHFRRDACANRRCKWSHAFSIAAFADGGEDGGTTEPAVACLPTVKAHLSLAAWLPRRASSGGPTRPRESCSS